MTAATSGASPASAPAKDRVVRLSDMTSPQRALVLALLAAARAAAQAKALVAA